MSEQPAQSFDRGAYQPRSPRRSNQGPRLSGGNLNVEDIPGAKPKTKAFDHKRGVDTTAKASHGIIYDPDSATKKEMMPDMQAKVHVAGAPKETADALIQKEKRLSASEYKKDVAMQAKKTVGIGAAEVHMKGNLSKQGLSYDREVGLQKKKETNIPGASDRYVEREMGVKSRPANQPQAHDQTQLFDHKAGTANKWDRESGKRVFGAPETEHLFQAKKEVGDAPQVSMKGSRPSTGNTTLFQAKKEVANAHSQDSVNKSIQHDNTNAVDNSIFQHKTGSKGPAVSMKASNPKTGNTTLFQAKKEVTNTRQAQVDTAAGVITGTGKGEKEQHLMQNKQEVKSTKMSQVDVAGSVLHGTGPARKEQHLMQNKKTVPGRPQDTAASVIFGS